MPRFDQWGLLPKGEEGPQDNPFLMVPLPVGHVGTAPLVMAKGIAARLPFRPDGTLLYHWTLVAPLWPGAWPLPLLR